MTFASNENYRMRGSHTPKRNSRITRNRTSRPRFRPDTEGLEPRIVMSTVNWVGPNGGDWDTAANWSPAGIPTSTSAVVINPSSAETIVHGTNVADSVQSITTSSTATLNLVSGSLAFAAGNASTLGGPVNISPQATLSVGAGASVQIASGQTLTDNGLMTLASGDTMTFATYYAVNLVVNGTMTATSDSFVTTGGGGSYMQVNSGGRFTSSNSTFSLSQLSLDNSSILNSGDWTGNVFNMPIFVPYNDVQNLGSNATFHDININADTLPSGTLNLNVIGSNAASHYIFPGGFTVASGATLAFGTNVPIIIPSSQTLYDNGLMTLASGDTMTFATYYAVNLVVNGTMTATSDSFVTTGGGGSYMQVNSGGRFTSSNSTFSLSQLSLDNSSILNSGDWTGNVFNMPIFVPYNDVQNLGSNATFHDININADTLPSGTLNLNVIGSNAASHYIFPGGFTVASGATLAFGTNVPIIIPSSQTLYDNGLMTLASGDTMTFATYYAVNLVVNGTMMATSDSFVTTGGGGSYMQVNSGGHFTSSNSTFSLSQLSLDNSSILNSGDWTGNVFNMPIFVPYNDVQYLGDNPTFNNVEINPGTLSSGAVTLGKIGTASTLQYVFPGGFTVASGSALVVGAYVPVVIPSGQTLLDNGTLSFSTGDTVTFASYYAVNLVVDGVMNASDASFVTTGGGGGYLQVNSGGQLDVNNSVIALSSVNLGTSSSDTLQANVFDTTLYVNGGETATISYNDFSASNSFVVASGNSSQTILMPSNWWGATDSTDIGKKITDYLDNPALPLVNFAPPLSAPNPAGAPSRTAAVAVTASYNPNSAQTVTLTAGVTSGSVAITGGTVTFIVVSNNGIVGTPDIVSVSGGVATTTTFQIPIGTSGGTDTIEAVYSGVFNSSTANYFGSMDTSQSLTINPAATTIVAKAASSTFNTGAVTVPLSATVTSTFGKLGVGTLTFTILTSGGVTVGMPSTVNVSNGVASTNYKLPAGTGGGSYTIQAVYNGTADYATKSDSAHKLTVKVATTSTAAQNQTATYNASSQSVTLTASVKSSAGAVNEGNVTFTILTTTGKQVGNPMTSLTVTGGLATVSYPLPPGLAVGTYKIEAVFGTTADFKTSTNGSKQTLTITAAPGLVTLGPPAGSLASSSGVLPQVTSADTTDLDLLIGLALEQLGAKSWKQHHST